MKLTKTILMIISLSLITSSLLADEWKLRKDKNGIKVFTRDVEGSKFKEFKAIVEIKTSMSTILSVFDDVDAYDKWIPNLAEQKLIQRIGKVI